MRLINENAARQTTDLFLHTCSYNSNNDDDDIIINSPSSNIGRVDVLVDDVLYGKMHPLYSIRPNWHWNIGHIGVLLATAIATAIAAAAATATVVVATKQTIVVVVHLRTMQRLHYGCSWHCMIFIFLLLQIIIKTIIIILILWILIIIVLHQQQ